MSLASRLTLFAQAVGADIKALFTGLHKQRTRKALIDFGTAALDFKEFTITDADVSPSSIIVISQSAEAAPGKEQDENEMDALFCRAVAGAGQFTVYVSCGNNAVSGKFYLNYSIGE